MNKISCFSILVISYIKYRVSRSNLAYWFWLFKNVIDPDARLFESECLIRFLLFSAIEDNNNVGLCGIFSELEEQLDKLGILDEYHDVFVAACDKAGEVGKWVEGHGENLGSKNSTSLGSE